MAEKKIVINRKFGGFSLSNLAIREYLKRKGKEVYFYTHRDNDFKKNVRWAEGEREFLCHSVLKDLGDNPENKELNEYYFSDRGIPRHDPDLVAVVEELGIKANGICADLQVVCIPADVDYVIEEYDGLESIHEKHRSWC